MKSAMLYTPENIQKLRKNEIFVFGSNINGKHGKGAALLAKRKFGAIQFKGSGRMGQSYAIPTRKVWKGGEITSLPIGEIYFNVYMFCLYARNHPELKFLVTKLGCGLAGFHPGEIAELFRKNMNSVSIHNNIILPKEFHDYR